MFNIPTQENDYVFKKVFEEFNSDKLLSIDKRDLVELIIEPHDRIDWLDRESPVRKKWSKFMTRKHPECESWNAKKFTTIASPLQTRVG